MDDLTPLTDGESIAFANLLIAMRDPFFLKAEYTNYRGEKSERTFIPEELWVGVTDWHPKRSLFLRAFDHDKQEYRDFRLEDFDMNTMRKAQQADQR